MLLAVEHLAADVSLQRRRYRKFPRDLDEAGVARRADPHLDDLPTDGAQRLRLAYLHSVPGAEVGRVVKQVVGYAGALVEQPLDEVQRVGAGAEQRHYAGELVAQVLGVQLRAERTDADVQRRAALVVNDVDVAAGGNKQVQNIDKLPVGRDVDRRLARLIGPENSKIIGRRDLNDRTTKLATT